MHDALPVRLVERIGYLKGDLKSFLDFQPPFGETCFERLAFEILHYQEIDSVLVPDIVEGTNMRVVQIRNGLRLAFEPNTQIGILGQMLWQDLDRNRALQAAIAGAVDFAHSTGSDRRQAGRNREELLPILPADSLPFHHAQKHFVDQSTGFKRVTGLFPREISMSLLPQIGINQRRQLFQGRFVTISPCSQQHRNARLRIGAHSVFLEISGGDLTMGFHPKARRQPVVDTHNLCRFSADFLA
jgi:hypothetical protein